MQNSNQSSTVWQAEFLSAQTAYVPQPKPIAHSVQGSFRNRTVDVSYCFRLLARKLTVRFQASAASSAR